MSTKLFIGNLDWSTEKEEIQSHFSQYGEIAEIIIVSDRENGHSRGFGFITYINEKSANHAVQNLDKTEFKGRIIGVKVAENNKERTSRYNGNGDNGNGNGYSNNNKNHQNGYFNNRRRNSRYNGSNNRRGSNPRYQKRDQC